MTTTLGVEVGTTDERVFHLVIDNLSERVLAGHEQLTPEDVISLIQDVCIDAMCAPSSLPVALMSIYTDAHSRRDMPEYGHTDFILKTLIHDVERAMKVV